MMEHSTGTTPHGTRGLLAPQPFIKRGVTTTLIRNDHILLGHFVFFSPNPQPLAEINEVEPRKTLILENKQLRHSLSCLIKFIELYRLTTSGIVRPNFKSSHNFIFLISS